MTVESKEFYDVMEAFENSVSKFARVGSFDKCEKSMWKDKQYYNHGETNKAFVCFFNGYMAGRLSYMHG